MAQLTLGATSQQIIGVTRRLVEISDSIGGSWRRAPFLDCQTASESVLPSLQEASLSYHYGTILREGASQFQRQRPLSLMGKYVRVRTRYGSGSWVTRWCGLIPRESVEVMGTQPSLSGRQVLAALGIEYLLGREAVATSWWLSGGNAAEVSAAVQFNQPGAGGALVGNRSTLEYETDAGESHIFSQTDGELWSAADIIRYLLAWHLPPGCPEIELAGQLDTLEAMEPLVTLSGQTILGIITGLVDRRRGLNARLVWNGGTTAQLRIATETTVPLRAGDVTLPANPSVVDLDLASGELRRTATV